MADSPNGTSGGDGLSMEKRLLLAFILMGAVLFLTPYFIKKPPPAVQPASSQPAEQAEQATAETPETTQQPAETPPESPVLSAAEIPGAESAAAVETVVIETDVFCVAFTNQGAAVKNWVLKDYKASLRPKADSDSPDAEPAPAAPRPDNACAELAASEIDRRLDLVSAAGAAKVGLPFQIEFAGNGPALNPNNGLFAVEKSSDGLRVEFRLSDGVTAYNKSFQFQRDSYLAEVSSSASQSGSPLPHFLVWRGGFGDLIAEKALVNAHTLFYDTVADKLVLNDADEAEDGVMTLSGDYSFAGVDDQFFAAVALRNGGPAFQLRVYADMIPQGAKAQEQLHPGAGIGGLAENEFSLFVGPKDVELLKEVDPRLEQLVDFGWFAILAKPLFMALQWVHSNWVGNWGWAIVIVTLAINTLLFPLKLTSMKSMKQMTVIQPEIKKIQDKYKGLGMRDPKKAGQNEEMMALYKKHNVNPAGGCLPMVLQIPFFFAFYKVLTVAIQLRGAEWLWIGDLSLPEAHWFKILPIAMVFSQFAMQKLTPTAAVAGPQQRIMYMMPLMMGFIFYTVSSGLVLYWFTSNLVGVAQQQIINRIGGKTAPPAEVVVEAKPKKKGRRK
jgi:YidC/Oxa1 family membrane protein insertase